MRSIARDLAGWAAGLRPSPDDLALADRSLRDTVAVALAARDHPVAALATVLGEGGRWAAAGHVLDFDDLHLSSTSHVSVVCVPAVLATGGPGPDLALAYLAGAGVMARLGDALGWTHYAAGWHATCTAGALGAAAGAAVALGLDRDRIATAIALAVPAAGGVQRAFGTDAKSLQVGFAVDAGVRAARLAAAGAGADLAAVDAWFGLVGGRGPAGPAGTGALDLAGPAVPGVPDLAGPAGTGALDLAGPGGLDLAGPAVPGGLAIKVYPCCYALQRPISALAGLRGQVDPGAVTRIVLRTPAATVAPLIHHRPETGLQAKFSLEYAAATALLDPYPGFAAFTDAAVRRPAARELVARVEVELSPGGDGLLAGSLAAEVRAGPRTLRVSQRLPPGSPGRPPTGPELQAKIDDCTVGLDLGPVTWSTAADLLRAHLPEGRA